MANEVTVREARAILPVLLDQAARGQETIITRHGKPIARIAPLEKTMSNIPQLRADVTRFLKAGDRAEDFDVDAIVDEIGETFGYDVELDSIGGEEFAAIVAKHDADAE